MPVAALGIDNHYRFWEASFHMIPHEEMNVAARLGKCQPLQVLGGFISQAASSRDDRARLKGN